MGIAIVLLIVVGLLALGLGVRALRLSRRDVKPQEAVKPVARVEPMPPRMKTALGVPEAPQKPSKAPEAPGTPESAPEAPVPPQVAQTAHQAPKALSRAVEAAQEASTAPSESGPRFSRPASQQPRERPKPTPQPKQSSPAQDLTWKKWNQ